MAIMLVVSVYGALVLLLASVALYMNMSIRREEIRLRHRERIEQRQQEEALRHAQAYEYEEALRREQAYNETQRVYSSLHNVNDPPSIPGHYLTFTFDQGGDKTAADFEEAIRVALDLPRDIAFLYGGEDDMLILVHRASYRNPLILTLIVPGVGSAVGALVFGARRVNNALQEIRRTNSETAAIQAGYRAEEAKENLTAKLYETLSAAIDQEDDDLRSEKLDRLHYVAGVAAEQGLVTVTHIEVGPHGVGRYRPTRPALGARPPIQENEG